MITLKASYSDNDFCLNVSEVLHDDIKYLGIMGKNGAGKSTLLRTLAGLQGKGAISVNHQTIQRCAMVFQRGALFPHLNTLKNLEFAFNHGSKTISVDSLVEAFSLRDLLDAPIDELSGGQRQRVAIARAFAQSPQLILFDEAFSALDWRAKLELYSQTKRLLEQLNIPALFVSHNSEEILAMTSHSLVIDSGKVVSFDRSEAVISLYFYDEATRNFSLNGSFNTLESGGIYTVTVDQQPLYSREVYIEGDRANVRLNSAKISVSLDRLSKSSMVNQLRGRLVAKHQISSDMLRLEVTLIDQRLFCDISLWSYQRLNLSINSNIWVNFKLL